MIKEISNSVIEEYRPAKADIDSRKPYLWLNEEEVQKDGSVQKVNTIFLTNRECPFTCTMCDLWRHTLDEPTPAGAIPEQVEFALERLPEATVIKLYNSGNFFDGKAIPKEDYHGIAGLLSGFEHVVVENHPKLIGPFIGRFKNMLNGTFEVAMGLETIHPNVLPALNKQITADDFKKATEYLTERGIDVRAFILLNPPFLLGEQNNMDWCLRTIDFAFDCGAAACTVIPTRGGNGIMEKLREQGQFSPPTLRALERTFEHALSVSSDRGRIFCDTWDLEKFSNCTFCMDMRKSRLDAMNLQQKVLPNVMCTCR